MKHNRNSSTYNAQNSYRWLERDRLWGVAVRTAEPHPGDRVTVITKAGHERQETVSQVLWTNSEVWLCRIAQQPRDVVDAGADGDATDEPVSTSAKYPHLVRKKPPTDA